MKTSRPFIHVLENERGVSAIIVAIVLLVLLGFAALAIDLGRLYSTKNELQNIADAAALTGANEIGNQFLNGVTLDPDDLEATVKSMAQDVASNSQAAEKYDIDILDNEIVIGTWDPDAEPKFEPGFPSGGEWPTAVRVIARRDDSANNPVTNIFARIFNIDSTDVVADATAALTGEGTVEPGEVTMPIGISEWWFDPSHWPEDGFCEQPIRFHPTGDLSSCAGWNTYDQWPASANELGEILDGLLTGDYIPPEATAGETFFAFIGGTLSNSVMPQLQALFEYHREGPIMDGESTIPLYYDEENNMMVYGEGASAYTPLMDTSVNPPEQKVLYDWESSVVVYSYEDLNRPCANPSGFLEIVGFAKVVVHAVNGPMTDPPTAHNTVFGEVMCDTANFGRGGGDGDFGTLGSIGGLVE